MKNRRKRLIQKRVMPSNLEPFERDVVNCSKEILSKGKTADQLVEVARQAGTGLDDVVRQIVEHLADVEQNESLIVCQKGCNYCCYGSNIYATVPEILAIAAVLHRQCSTEELEGVKERCRQHIAPSQGLPILGNLKACPLLVEGLCSVYDDRPLVCRGFFSLDVEPCRRRVEQPEDKMDLKTWLDGFLFARLVSAGVAEALQGHRLDGRLFTLSHALLIILEQPDAIDRYLRGEKVFNDALRA